MKTSLRAARGCEIGCEIGLSLGKLISLVSRGAAWSLGYVQQHAARHGFMVGALPGRLVQPGEDEGAPPVHFYLNNEVCDMPSAVRQGRRLQRSEKTTSQNLWP